MRKIIYTTKIVSIITLSACLLYSIYGNLFPQKIAAGSLTHTIGSAIAMLVFIICIILGASIQYMIPKKYPQLAELFNTVPRFNVFEIIVLTFLGIYLIYRIICIIIFGSATIIDNANGNMAFIALEMILNFYIFVIIKNYLKHYT